MLKKLTLLTLIILSFSALGEEIEKDELRIGLKLGKGQSGLSQFDEQALINNIKSDALVKLFDGCLIKKEVQTKSEIEFLANATSQEEVIEFVETNSEVKLSKCINSNAGQLSILGLNKLKVKYTEEAGKVSKIKLYFTTKLENLDLQATLDRVRAISTLPENFTSKLTIIKK